MKVRNVLPMILGLLVLLFATAFTSYGQKNRGSKSGNRIENRSQGDGHGYHQKQRHVKKHDQHDRRGYDRRGHHRHHRQRHDHHRHYSHNSHRGHYGHHRY